LIIFGAISQKIKILFHNESHFTNKKAFENFYENSIKDSASEEDDYDRQP
jgi:hypothetical protein